MNNLTILERIDDLVAWVYKGYDGTSRILGGLAQDALLDDPDIELKFNIRACIKHDINEWTGYEEPKEDPCFGCCRGEPCFRGCPIGRTERWRRPA